LVINKPWLALPPKLAHDISAYLLKPYAKVFRKDIKAWRKFTWKGLEFQNPLGISGGVDKNAELIDAWWDLGAGYLEIGTVTPLPQNPNPGKIIARNIKELSVWNKMGFPSKGLDYVVKQLKKIPAEHKTPLLINIGKNRKTANDDAHQDYIQCIKALNEYTDAFVINISSPNTKNLRDLLDPENLKAFLKPILDYKNTLGKKTPVLLKLSPDISHKMLTDILEISLDLDIDGWVLTNSTIQRGASSNYPTEGGVSGKPITHLSRAMLKDSIEILGDRRGDKLIISSGGIFDSSDVKDRLVLGANLVQVYSALVFNGPSFFNDTLADLTLEDTLS